MSALPVENFKWLPINNTIHRKVKVHRGGVGLTPKAPRLRWLLAPAQCSRAMLSPAGGWSRRTLSNAAFHEHRWCRPQR